LSTAIRIFCQVPINEIIGKVPSRQRTLFIDPLIFAATAVFVVVLALAAAAIPARKAMSVDPMVALKYE